MKKIILMVLMLTSFNVLADELFCGRDNTIYGSSTMDGDKYMVCDMGDTIEFRIKNSKGELKHIEVFDRKSALVIDDKDEGDEISGISLGDDHRCHFLLDFNRNLSGSNKRRSIYVLLIDGKEQVSTKLSKYSYNNTLESKIDKLDMSGEK